MPRSPLDGAARPPNRARLGRARRYRERDDQPRHDPEVPMSQHPRAGQPALPSELVDVPALLRAYDEIRPDPSDPAQRVAFGTSGHRGSAFRAAFNEPHILATTEAICRYRAAQGYTGPLFIGRDTHALSEPAWRTALEVLVGERRRRARRQRGRLHADARRLARDPRRQPRRVPRGARRRHRRHAVAQPARRRRLQVQPAQRRPGRHRRHALDPGRGEPDPRGVRARRARRHPPRPLRAGARAGGRARLPRHVRRRPRERRRHGGHRGVRAAPRRGPAGRRGGRLLGR